MKFPKKGKRQTKDSFKGLVAILDKVFSEYVRRSDCNNGSARCITCPTILHWTLGDAGHFVTRNHFATRWDRKNVNFQCPACNRFRGGEQHLHGLAIDRKYGKGTAEQLQAISRVYSGIDVIWLKHHIELYRGKIKELKNKC